MKAKWRNMWKLRRNVKEIWRNYEDICSSIHGPWELQKFRTLPEPTSYMLGERALEISPSPGSRAHTWRGSSRFFQVPLAIYRGEEISKVFLVGSYKYKKYGGNMKEKWRNMKEIWRKNMQKIWSGGRELGIFRSSKASGNMKKYEETWRNMKKYEWKIKKIWR